MPAFRLIASAVLASALFASSCAQDRPDRVMQGRVHYQRSCGICHGAEAGGMPGLGKGLKGNAFIAQRSEAELVGFLKVGRRSSDPLNETGVDMPPRGGNQGLTDEDLAAIAAFLKTLP